MTSELTPMTPGASASYEELGAHRHLVISERLRARRRDLGLTQKEVVARLRRIGVATTNKALSSPRARCRPRRRASSPSSPAHWTAR